MRANLLIMRYAHPLLDQIDIVKKRHIAVFEHVKTLPYVGEPWISPEFVIAICKKGWMKGRYDMAPFLFRQNDITMIYPDHAVIAHQWSDDYDVTLIVASSKWARQQHIAFPVHNILEHVIHPDFHLTDEQIVMVDHMVKVIDDMSRLNDDNIRDELLKRQMDNFVRMIDYFRSADPSLSRDFLSTPKRIAYRFYEDLVANYNISRETKFYADKQNISAKHFGSTIYEVTGIHVSEWISRYIITKAKMLLLSRPDLTVAQIGHAIGFEEPTDFGRYFKRITGTSPAAFRNSQLAKD